MCNETGVKGGDYFTVVKWIRNDDRSYIGEIFKAICIDGTLIHAESNTRKDTFRVLDTNRLVVRKVSECFVRNVNNKGKCCCCGCD